MIVIQSQAEAIRHLQVQGQPELPCDTLSQKQKRCAHEKGRESKLVHARVGQIQLAGPGLQSLGGRTVVNLLFFWGEGEDNIPPGRYQEPFQIIQNTEALSAAKDLLQRATILKKKKSFFFKLQISSIFSYCF